MGIIRTPEELKLDNTPLTFGKYYGQTPNDVAEFDKQYIVWMYGKVTNRQTCSIPLAKACGYVEMGIPRDPSTRDLPLHGQRESTRIKDHFDSYDDDIPF